ncbi:TM0106 family RecB-like putative nuclease [Telmatobacter sp. DSM 110680]|uniref:TM0106 family RecB-like putative nuclease n=1 Tax=Telmatobacter sp. DSM 110680 TaxID=3036704 RepID=A0AAU7DJX3_9BACT
MRIVASDLMSLYLPSPCSGRVIHRFRGEEEAEPTEFDRVLRELGRRHEQEHLQSLGAVVDLSRVPKEERFGKTLEAIAARVAVIYQPAFRLMTSIDGIECELVGYPDFLILNDDEYIIRDSKMARRIDDEHHPEIVLQVGLYGYLFEQACGRIPKAIQVHSGTNAIVDVPYDGGVNAMAELRRIIALRATEGEFYEPVGWSKCSACGFKEKCWETAKQIDDVAILPDVDQSLAIALHGIGVTSISQLLQSFDITSLSEFKRPVGKRIQKVGKKAERILLFAESMKTKQELVLAIPAIPSFPNYVMFDLEGMPPYLDETDKIYLWGMRVFGSTGGEFMPAVAGFGPDGDRDGWLEFLRNADSIFQACGDDIPFVHWASYEKTHISQYSDRYGDPNGVAAHVKANLLDLLTIAHKSIVLPLPSFSLKVIEKHIGYQRTQEEYGGTWSIAQFILATETRDEQLRAQIMDQILKYNDEDLEATWAVFEWLRGKNPSIPSA